MSTVIDSLFWELGIDPAAAAKIEESAVGIETSGEKIAAAAQTAEDAVTSLVEELLKTPEGARQVEQVLQRLTPPLDDVAAGMTFAASSTARWQEGLRALSVQQADAAARTAALNAPLDRVAAGLTFAASGASKWEQGLRNLSAQQAAASGGAKDGASAFELHGQGARKAENAIAALALSQVGLEGTTGKLVEGLLLLGAGSALVTGVAAGVAIIGAAYRKLGEEARKTKEAADGVHTAVEQSLQTPIGTIRRQLDEAQARIDDLQAKSSQAVEATNRRLQAEGFTPSTAPSSGLTPAEQTELDQLNTDRARLTNQLKRAQNDQANAFADQLRQLQFEEAALVQVIRARTTEGLDTESLRRQLTEVRGILAQVQAASPADRGRLTEQLKADVAAQQGALESVRQGLIQKFTAILPETVGATAEAIAQLATRLREAGASTVEVQTAVAPLITRLQELAAAADQVQLDQILQLGPEQALEALDQLRAKLVTLLPDDQTSSQAQALLARIAVIDQAREKVNRQLVSDYKAQADATSEVLDNTGDATTEATKHKLTLNEIASITADVARGALGIAQAFGIANDHTAALFQNVISVASSLPDLIQGIGALGTAGGNPVATASKAAAVLGGVAGLLSGLFGESAAERRFRETQESLREAIEDLRKSIDKTVPGTSVTSAQAAAGALLAVPSDGGGIFGKGLTGAKGTLNTSAVNAALAPLGLTLRQFEDLLKSINPNLKLDTDSAGAFIASLKLAKQALDEANFRAFAETFAGQLSYLQARANLLDLTNPIDQLKAIQDVAKGKFGSPALTKALEGLDLTTTAGRDQATQNLLALLDQLNSAKGLTGTELGSLSSSELQDLIGQIAGLLDQLKSGGSAGIGAPQQGVSVVQTITEVSSGRLIATLVSQDSHLVEIRDLLARGSLGAIAAPPLPATTTGAALNGAAPGLVVNISQLVLPSSTGTAPDQLRAAGAAVGVGLASGLDQALGQRYATRKVLVGDILVAQ